MDTVMMEVQVYPSRFMMLSSCQPNPWRTLVSVERKKIPLFGEALCPVTTRLLSRPPDVALESIIGTPTRVEFVPIFRWQPSIPKFCPVTLIPTAV